MNRAIAAGKLLHAVLPRAIRADVLEGEVAQLREALSRAQPSSDLEEKVKRLEEEVTGLKGTLAGEAFAIFFSFLPIYA